MTTSNATKNKRKGAQWELDLLDYFRSHQLVAERLRLAGKHDEGDVMVYIDGKTVLIVEAKNEQSFKPGPWINEANIEAANWAVARKATVEVVPIVVAKRRNHGTGKAYVIMELDTFMERVNK
jgi:Holliday junction resolvase